MPYMLKRILLLKEHQSHQITLLLVLVVFILTSVIGSLSGNRLRYPDEREYNQLAQSILSGNGYRNSEGEPTAYRPPGWPFLLSVIYRLSPYPLAAKLFNAFACACTAGLLSVLVARIIPEGRIFSPLLVLLYPAGMYTASTLYPQTFATLLFVAILILLINRQLTSLLTSAAGMLFGLLVLTVPSFLLITPLLLIGILAADRRNLSFFISRSALFLLCMAMVIAPWSIRNARLFGGIVPVSTNSGINLLLGNSENTGPNSGVRVDLSRYEQEVTGMDEFAKNERFSQQAISWMRANPRAAARLYFLKVINYFNFRAELATKGEQSPVKDAVMFLSYYPLLFIAIIRLLACRRYRLSRAEALLYVLYFGNALTSAIYFTRIRFRIPFDALLIGIAAGSLGLLVHTMKAKKTEPYF